MCIRDSFKKCDLYKIVLGKEQMKQMHERAELISVLYNFYKNYWDDYGTSIGVLPDSIFGGTLEFLSTIKHYSNYEIMGLTTLHSY